MDEEDLHYNMMIEQRDGMCDHVDTMRRPKKEKETLAILHPIPWMGHQVKEAKERKEKRINKEKEQKPNVG